MNHGSCFADILLLGMISDRFHDSLLGFYGRGAGEPTRGLDRAEDIQPGVVLVHFLIGFSLHFLLKCTEKGADSAFSI